MIPAHFICWNHFYSFLGSDPRPGNQEVWAAGESPYSFSTEPLFLIPSRRNLRQGSQEVGLAGMHCLFSREPIFLIPSGWDRKPWKPRDRVRRGAVHLFSREPLSLIPF